MDKKPLQPTGAKLLVKKFKNNFRIPENLNHYSKEDYQQAEKKYLRFCLTTGMCEGPQARGDSNDDNPRI